MHAGLEPFPLSELPPEPHGQLVSFQVSSRGHRGQVRLGRAGTEPALAWPQSSDLDRTQGSVWMLPQAHCPSSGQPPKRAIPGGFIASVVLGAGGWASLRSCSYILGSIVSM